MRDALSRSPGSWIYPGAQAVFGATNVLYYHKPGYAGGWDIDNGYVRAKDTGEEYVLSIALPDTTPIFTDIARVVLGALHSGTLRGTRLAP